MRSNGRCLTNEPVAGFDDAWRRDDLVRAALDGGGISQGEGKTGCRIEDMQFTTTDRLEPAIALLSVVALTLLNLREASRRDRRQHAPRRHACCPAITSRY